MSGRQFRPEKDWLPALPPGWTRCRLGDLADVDSGFPFKSELFSNEGGVRVVRVRDVASDDDPVNYTGEFAQRYLVREGDLLIGMDGDFNVRAWATEKALLNQRVGRVRADTNALQRWVHYSLPRPLKMINDLTYSTTVKHLSSPELAAIHVGVPAQGLHEILNWLDRETARIDALIAKKERLLELLEEKRQALVSHAVTKGLDPNASMKVSGLPSFGSVPLGWTLAKNKSVFKEINDPSADGSEELLTVSHITGVTKRSEKEVYMFQAETNEGYKRCRSGDLVINTMWAWMGAAGVAWESGVVSPGYAVYRPTTEIHAPYFDLLVRTPAYRTEMMRYSKGVWRSRLRLYPEEFLGLRTPLPSLEEQRKIVSLVNDHSASHSALRETLRRSVALLRERRQSLITAAVTGQLDPAIYMPAGGVPA